MEFEHADAINQAIRLLSLRHRARAAALLAPLGLYPGQEALLLELARTGPMIQAQLSEALGCEPPSVTLMTRKLEASGHLRRAPAPSDKRASVVELTDRGQAVAEQVKELWCALAQETVTGLPAETVTELPGLLNTLTRNVDTRRPDQPRGHRPGLVAESRRAGRIDQRGPRTGDYEPSALGFVRDHVEQIVRTGTTDGVTMKGQPMVLMTYLGARSGKVRKTPVMRVEHEGSFAAVASNGAQPANPQWYSSLLAEPVIELQDRAVTRQYRAREVFGDEKALWWRRAVDAFPDYADYQRGIDRQIPVLVLEPVTDGTGPAGSVTAEVGPAE
ncbi:nitroreductase family deazaflavin-dependent oxidoreductase [Frankia sp. AgB1.9]|uniref:nitroreductase/quinone reductase family protein n=1 Tax=unclassified Frankia TaxID=2632575 RepID=UPI0019331FF9|nr:MULTISPECIES: nitroreductase/quinone reductase family protein [unclassified Frankia]MBL7488925.1 nitroreductase family deazaflavin-dependent oxidoreductase [Frankia sp. AgW1.1]MBL7546728.1 nitroreductase family deazaflavin-dependent oxidoreductase [Frankia sp. AgB1.9]MBL7621822.1 nitroreductase family deazaflavin-dependent oxidoreductase [Frankia sp. AgB1.8]